MTIEGTVIEDAEVVATSSRVPLEGGGSIEVTFRSLEVVARECAERQGMSAALGWRTGSVAAWCTVRDAAGHPVEMRAAILTFDGVDDGPAGERSSS